MHQSPFDLLSTAEGDFVTAYRCYLMSGEKIQTVQTFECTDDAEVILKATALLNAHPEHQSVEIWEGKRMVAHVPRREQSEEMSKIVMMGTKKGDD